MKKRSYLIRHKTPRLKWYSNLCALKYSILNCLNIISIITKIQNSNKVKIIIEVSLGNHPVYVHYNIRIYIIV